jgi:hypothetical protein
MTPVQRMVVSHDGTLQELLSAYFGSPVKVTVHNQIDNYGVIIRNSALYTGNTNNAVDVCLATSVMRTVNPSCSSSGSKFIERIRQCEHGIGFVLNDLGIQTHREILDIHVNEDMFRRVYRIFDDDGEIDIIITEVFPSHMYKCDNETQ